MHPKIINSVFTASQLLQAGKLVSFPTETVYGLGADARNEQAISEIFTLKGRPTNHPLIVHLANSSFLANVALEIPDYAYALAQQFWPGALTLVLKKSPTISNLITGKQDTVAVRVPQHPLTIQLLQDFPLGLVGPSANKFGKISPTCSLHVIDDLGTDANFAGVLDGGPCQIGIESTIVDCSQKQPSILRHGHLSTQEIEDFLGLTLSTPSANIRISGNLKTHYAPITPTLAGTYVEIIDFLRTCHTPNIGVLSFHPLPFNFNGSWLLAHTSPHTYAQHLYKNLRQLDREKLDYILIEQPTENMLWAGINERLAKATSGIKIANFLFDKTFVPA